MTGTRADKFLPLVGVVGLILEQALILLAKKLTKESS